jgi:hypothetical protein
MACFKVLDQDDQVVGIGLTVDQAIRDAASNVALPWDEGPTGEQVVKGLIEAGEFRLALP